jgi:hypothetical protein
VRNVPGSGCFSALNRKGNNKIAVRLVDIKTTNGTQDLLNNDNLIIRIFLFT